MITEAFTEKIVSIYKRAAFYQCNIIMGNVFPFYIFAFQVFYSKNCYCDQEHFSQKNNFPIKDVAPCLV